MLWVQWELQEHLHKEVKMNWVITENNKRINTFNIPTISIEEIRNDFGKLNMRLIGFFGKQEYENVRLFVILADDKIGKLYVTSTLFEKARSPIIGLSGFVFTSIQGAKFRLNPQAASSFDISFD